MIRREGREGKRAKDDMEGGERLEEGEEDKAGGEKREEGEG
jgi:hypothetical protein